MKRIACLMLVVSIACAGCEVKESSTSRIIGPDVQSVSPGVSHTLPGVTRMPLGPDDGWSNRMGMYSELKERIERVEEVLSQIKIAPRPDKALLARIAELGAELESQRAELRASVTKLKEDLSEAKITPEQDKALLVRIANLETALESQRAELRENITKLKEGLPKPEGTSGGGWFTSAAIATIISALIAGGVAVHMSRKDTLSPKTL